MAVGVEEVKGLLNLSFLRLSQLLPVLALDFALLLGPASCRSSCVRLVLEDKI